MGGCDSDSCLLPACGRLPVLSGWFCVSGQWVVEGRTPSSPLGPLEEAVVQQHTGSELSWRASSDDDDDADRQHAAAELAPSAPSALSVLAALLGPGLLHQIQLQYWQRSQNRGIFGSQHLLLALGIGLVQ